MTDQEDVVQVRKKGRPRKTPIEENPQIKEKKKRGRKKKEKVTEDEIKIKRKRGRKAAVKYFNSSIRKKIPLAPVLKDESDNILHLNIKDTDELENNKDHSISNIFKESKTSEEINTRLEELFNERMLLREKENHNIEQLINFNTDYHKEDIEKFDIKNSLPNFLNNNTEFLEISKTQDIINKYIEYDINANSNEIKKNKISNSENQKTSSQFQNVILKNFLNNWCDNSSNIKCWWCCHEFDSVPIGLPVHYDKNADKYRVRGIYCSFGCMLSNNPQDKLKYKNLISSLYSSLTGVFLYHDIFKKIKEAPPRYFLQMFGGNMDIEQFRNAFAYESDKIYKLIKYPMCIQRDYIEKIDLHNVKMLNKNLLKKQYDTVVSNTVKSKVENNNTVKSETKSAKGIDKFVTFL